MPGLQRGRARSGTRSTASVSCAGVLCGSCVALRSPWGPPPGGASSILAERRDGLPTRAGGPGSMNVPSIDSVSAAAGALRRLESFIWWFNVFFFIFWFLTFNYYFLYDFFITIWFIYFFLIIFFFTVSAAVTSIFWTVTSNSFFFCNLSNSFASSFKRSSFNPLDFAFNCFNSCCFNTCFR